MTDRDAAKISSLMEKATAAFRRAESCPDQALCNHYKKVAQAYLQLAVEEHERIVIVEERRSRRTVH
jgi:thymidylate kinase